MTLHHAYAIDSLFQSRRQTLLDLVFNLYLFDIALEKMNIMTELNKIT